MSTKFRFSLWPASLAMLAVISWLAWSVVRTPGLLKDCYGQWVVAELVIRFHGQHDRLPCGWQDLEPVFEHYASFRQGRLSFAEVRERITVDFAGLCALDALARRTTNAAHLPRPITPASGRQAHWAEAEPNRMVFDYFADCEHRRLVTNSMSATAPVRLHYLTNLPAIG
jgi:hypothetical protein